MKEKYFSPTILNANTMALSMNENAILENILAAVMKKIMSNSTSSIVGNLAPSASMRRVFGTNIGAKNFTLTKRKFEEVFS